MVNRDRGTVSSSKQHRRGILRFWIEHSNLGNAFLTDVDWLKLNWFETSSGRLHHLLRQRIARRVSLTSERVRQLSRLNECSRTKAVDSKTLASRYTQSRRCSSDREACAAWQRLVTYFTEQMLSLAKQKRRTTQKLLLYRERKVIRILFASLA